MWFSPPTAARVGVEPTVLRAVRLTLWGHHLLAGGSWLGYGFLNTWRVYLLFCGAAVSMTLAIGKLACCLAAYSVATYEQLDGIP